MTAEKATNEPKEYSRAEITALDKRKETADAIRQKNGGKDLTKTTEGKSQLSDEWMNKAGLSPKQKERVLKELNIDPKDSPDQKAQKIAEWQEKNSLAGKDGKGDGILGWATLEALDKKIEEQDVKYDTNPDNNSDHGGALEKGNRVNPTKLKYGLDRVAYNENNERINEASKAQKEVNDFIVRLGNQQRLEDAQKLIDKNDLSEASKKLLYTTLDGKNMIGSKWVATKFKDGIYQLAEQKTENKSDSIRVEKENIAAGSTPQEDQIDAIRWRYRENPQQAEGKIAALYRERPDDFILDKATDGLPIFQNAENNSKEEMTSLIRGLQIQVPKGTYYQKTGDGWVKYENNKPLVAKSGKFSTDEFLAKK